MKKYLIALLCITSLVTYSQTPSEKGVKWSYPEITPDTTIDIYFGHEIIDPFRNLENLDDTLVKTWHKEQQQFYDSIIHSISNWDTLKKEVNSYKNQRKYWSELPRSVGEMIFFSSYCYETEVYTLNYRHSASDTTIELFSTDSLKKADNIKYSIDYYEPSGNGKYIAFALSYKGTENSTMYILDVQSKKILSDKIKNARYGNPQWLPDGNGFFYQEYIYNKLPDGKKQRDVCVKVHYLNTKPKNDKVILSEKLNTNIKLQNIDFPLLFMSHNSDFILAHIHKGSEKYPTIYYAPLHELLTFTPENINWKLVFKPEDLVSDSYIIKNQLYYLTFKDNPKGQVMKMSILQPDKTKLLFNANENILKSFVLNKNSIYVRSYNKNIYQLNRIEIESENVSSVKIHLKGSIYLKPSFRITDFYQNSNALIFLYQSWNQDQCIMHYHPDSNHVEFTDIFPQNEYSIINNTKIDLVEVPSHDGTKVPLTIFYNSDIELNGQNPLIIEAYGCYGYTFSPNYKAARKAWLKKGGIFALAHVRGGGEKGEAWYRAGYKDTKSNSWKDLISCSEYLINKGYTSSEKLAAIGTSCGGITVGRAITERPELFEAAVISVGRLNTLRHETEYSIANIAEYGTIKDSSDFKNLYKMDVFHHIKPGADYPSLLISTGINDPRVSPWQSGKTVARFQNVSSKGNNIVLFHISYEEGHKRFSESAESYAFLLWQTGHPKYSLKPGAYKER